MVVEAKPPLQKKPGVGTVLLIALGVVLLCGTTAIGLSMIGYRLLASNAHDEVVYSKPSSPEFEARFAAAQNIYDLGERDLALTVLAGRYAENGAEAARAIGAMTSYNDRDLAAWQAAKRFEKQDRPQDALAVIALIVDRSTSDAAHHAVATGVWPDDAASEAVSDASLVVEAAAEAANAN